MSGLEVAGPALTLRLAREDDAQALFELARDEQVTQWFSWGPYESIEQPRAYIERLEGQRERGEQLDLIIDHHERGPIGVTGLNEFSLRDRRAIVGTWFGREWWGTGANAESKALLAHLAFGPLGLERISSYSNPENGRSETALEKVGFEAEGVLRAWHRHGERALDVTIWRMLRSEWESSPLHDVPATISGEPPPAFLP